MSPMTFKEFWKTIVGVVIIVVLSLTGAAVYDNISGGPEAREASVDTKEILDGFQEAIEQSECVTSYDVAESASDGLLIIAISKIIESSLNSEMDIPEEQVHDLHEAIDARIYYLILSSRTNEKCNPNREGGPEPLSQSDAPDLSETGD